jgi:hypothetical protein
MLLGGEEEEEDNSLTKISVRAGRWETKKKEQNSGCVAEM